MWEIFPHSSHNLPTLRRLQQLRNVGDFPTIFPQWEIWHCMCDARQGTRRGASAASLPCQCVAAHGRLPAEVLDDAPLLLRYLALEGTNVQVHGEEGADHVEDDEESGVARAGHGGEGVALRPAVPIRAPLRLRCQASARVYDLRPSFADGDGEEGDEGVPYLVGVVRGDVR